MATADAGLHSVQRVYGFWGRHPVLYALQDYVTFLGRPAAVRGAAVSALKVKAGASVLEVACGTGRNFPHLVRAIGPGGRLTGFDYSAAMLAAAAHLTAKRGFANVELIQGDAAVLDVGKRELDAAISVLGMSAIPNFEAALERTHAVLRPGGVLVVCDARLFTGPLACLNPLIRRVYARFAAWRPDRDIPGAMRRIFGNVAITTYNLGSFVIARSVKA